MSVNGENWYSSIALATADNIAGPYTYQGTVVYSGFVNSTQAAKTDYSKVTGTNTVASRYLTSGKWNPSYAPNAIDPSVLYDANGDLWMSYGSWFGGLFMMKLDKNTGLRDYSYTYSTTTNSSDQYFGKRISGGYGGTGEGSYVVYDQAAGYYYLYVSYNGLNATDNFAGYHMRLFRSTSITGPYTDAMGNSAIVTSAGQDQSNKGGANTDGANILQWTHWGGDMQKFEIVNVNGAYAIKTKVSGGTKALDVYNISSADGADVVQWTYWGGDGQSWYLEPAN
ncbi:hypothetical protein BK126_07665 [Paenibacillus sp. FSL H7-0326]|uniref:RICIN domain-containing protein n=1 Tax=Paenibacillus sp. FSL H7-0326 TaxID=1921144 RepID=UPI00096E2B47|nr:RICIN domain-containing protein [Paenibacillus sp. FSL H7-0326]OMC71901.1 hypothetical protein BK126_07665 [Paenibacillus sp. FSL H7-0326]